MTSRPGTKRNSSAMVTAPERAIMCRSRIVKEEGIWSILIPLEVATSVALLRNLSRSVSEAQAPWVRPKKILNRRKRRRNKPPPKRGLYFKFSKAILILSTPVMISLSALAKEMRKARSSPKATPGTVATWASPSKYSHIARESLISWP